MIHKLENEIVAILLPRLADEYKAISHYRACANYAYNQGFSKAGEYFENESNDEFEHAKKLEKYLTDWNVSFTIPMVSATPQSFKDLGDTLDSSYMVEYKLYEDYEKDSNKILELGDSCTFDFLQFYRETQRKSVAEYSDKLNLLEGIERTKINFALLEKKLF